MAKGQSRAAQAAGGSSAPTETKNGRKRSLAVPISEVAEKGVRDIADATRIPLKDVLARLGRKVEEELLATLAEELAEEASIAMREGLKAITGGALAKLATKPEEPEAGTDGAV